ncbi:MAG: DUF371 domain-containing protein [Nitrososphaeraceae archaeon]|nr:DUF371 domain-containing protein [Nitrososphaeraceae archaeon]
MKEERVTFVGNRNIRCLHNKTIEITKAVSLSTRGDCIAGVSASKACNDFDKEFKARFSESGRKVNLEIKVDEQTFRMHGFTDQRLTLSHDHDIVIRRSNYVCPRTLCVLCNKASFDIPRELVLKLQDPATAAVLKIFVE